MGLPPFEISLYNGPVMADDMRLLEERVSRAVDRLKRLHEERDQLRQELRTLEQQLEASTASALLVDRVGDSWKTERIAVVAAIRETLDELQAESAWAAE